MSDEIRPQAALTLAEHGLSQISRGRKYLDSRPKK